MQFNTTFPNQLELEILDQVILSTYIQFGIFHKVLDEDGNKIGEDDVPQNAETITNFIPSGQSTYITGETYTFQISFMTSNGLMIINHDLVAP